MKTEKQNALNAIRSFTGLMTIIGQKEKANQAV